MAVNHDNLPNPARQQHDDPFSALSTPFISCLIGGTTEKAGGIFIGNDNLTLKDGGRLDPKYITSITITRNAVKERTEHFLSAIMAYLTTMNREITPEELKRFGKDKKALEKTTKEIAQNKKNAPKTLRKALKSLVETEKEDQAAGETVTGISGTINLTITSDMGILLWLCNYCIAQNMTPAIRLQYGITAGGGKRQRISPIMDGIITSAVINDFFNVTLEVTFLPPNALGWSPEQFNKIFGSDKKQKTNKEKSNNPKQSSQQPSDEEKKAYKEGDIVIDTNGARTRNYSKVVAAIVKGLGWKKGFIEPTKDLSEDAMITVESFEQGPLAYIQNNFCAKKDSKDGDGKTMKAEAVSVGGYRDYMAFFDYDKDKQLAFYYLPAKIMTEHKIQNMRIYEYTIQGTNSGEYQSEVIEFSVPAFDFRAHDLNLYKTDGKSNVGLPVVSNSRKEVSNIKYTTESSVKSGNAANTNKTNKGTAQTPTYRNMLSADTQTALNSFLANLDFNLLNTWGASQPPATMKILYDESVRLYQLIYVCVLLPMNDSTSIGGGRNLKKVIHPTSGLYRVMNVSDEINNSSAYTTLTLNKVPYSQETIDRLNEILHPDLNRIKAEQKKQQEMSKNRPEDKTAKNE